MKINNSPVLLLVTSFLNRCPNNGKSEKKGTADCPFSSYFDKIPPITAVSPSFNKIFVFTFWVLIASPSGVTSPIESLDTEISREIILFEEICGVTSSVNFALRNSVFVPDSLTVLYGISGPCSITAFSLSRAITLGDDISFAKFFVFNAESLTAKLKYPHFPNIKSTLLVGAWTGGILTIYSLGTFNS